MENDQIPSQSITVLANCEYYFRYNTFTLFLTNPGYLRYYQSKIHCPVLVVRQGGGQCISP